jgi:hypothetical protein
VIRGGDAPTWHLFLVTGALLPLAFSPLPSSCFKRLGLARIFANAVPVFALLVWIGAILALYLASAPCLQFIAVATSYVESVGIALSFWHFVLFFTARRASILGAPCASHRSCGRQLARMGLT